MFTYIDDQFFCGPIAFPKFNKLNEWIKGVFERNKMNPQSEIFKPLGAGYVPPTPEELSLFKNSTGYSMKQLADLVDANPKHLRNYFSDRSYIAGKYIPYAIWRYWLESFGFVDVCILEPKQSFMRSKIFSADIKNWTKPTIQEFRAIVHRSALSTEAVARILTTEHKSVEGKLVTSLIRSNKVKEIFHVDHEAWMKLLRAANLNSLSDYKAFPKLREETLLPQGDGYTPPTPKEIRQLVAWSGYSFNELEEITGVPGNRLEFFSTNRSQRTNVVELNSKSFSNDDWVAPTFQELRAFMTYTSINEHDISMYLKLGKRELKAALNTRDNVEWKKQPLTINKDDWFKLLDVKRIFNMNALKAKSEKEAKAHYINYSVWRMLLSSFGIVEPVKLARK